MGDVVAGVGVILLRKEVIEEESIGTCASCAAPIEVGGTANPCCNDMRIE